jgi:hypothetical protein
LEPCLKSISLGIGFPKEMDMKAISGLANFYSDFRYSVRSAFSEALNLRLLTWSYLATTSASVFAEPS